MEKVHSNIKEQLDFWSQPLHWMHAKKGEVWAQSFGGTTIMWTGFIKPRIKDYLKGDILEIGPGFGNLTKFLLRDCNSIELVDISKICIEECQNLKSKDKITYTLGNGYSLENTKSESKDFVFSWGTFIHLHKDVIELYLEEIHRVLKPGGKGFIHHSFLSGGSDTSFDNMGGRSNMQPDEFRLLSEQKGLKLIEQENFQHYVNGHLLFDTVTTIEK